MRSAVAAAVLAAIVSVGVPTSADAPTVVINSPTAGAPIFSAVFPFVQPITFTVTHDDFVGQPRDISDVRNLEVLITHNGNTTSLPGSYAAEPWKVAHDPGCNVGAAYSACVVPDANTGSATINWTVPAPGTYGITVRTFHTGDLGEDVEEVSFALVSTEYPAPPAVANAYIKSTFGKLGAKAQGCVISRIAEDHAKRDAFGPKGGPYDIGYIHASVDTYVSLCR